MGRSAFARIGLLALASGAVLGGGGPVSAAPHKDEPPRCRLTVAEVKDIRADPSMGGIGAHAASVPDPAAWVRDELKALSSNSALEIVSADAHPDLTMNVELVKAYVQSITTTKSATVVLRVTFSGRSTESKVYRGVHNAANWASTTGEMQGALKLALDSAVQQVSTEAPVVCASGHVS